MTANVSNFGLVTLDASITSGSLTATLSTGDNANIPAVPFYLCLWDSVAAESPALTNTREIVLVTAVSGVNITAMTRAQEGTVATAFNSGIKGIVVPVASMWTEIRLGLPAYGTGSPNGVVDGNRGRVYIDTAANDVYFKSTASGTLTGWV